MFVKLKKNSIAIKFLTFLGITYALYALDSSKYYTANRPFIFLLLNKNKMPLFEGRIIKPSRDAMSVLPEALDQSVSIKKNSVERSVSKSTSKKKKSCVLC